MTKENFELGTSCKLAPAGAVVRCKENFELVEKKVLKYLAD